MALLRSIFYWLFKNAVKLKSYIVFKDLWGLIIVMFEGKNQTPNDSKANSAEKNVIDFILNEAKFK